VEDPADVELLKSYNSGDVAANEANPADAVVVRDFYKKFYNSLGRVHNCCSSSIGKTQGLLSFSRGNRLGSLNHGLTEF
ncbi:hypothetical protein Tco_1259171, partial [Tanacetum coccineum]